MIVPPTAEIDVPPLEAAVVETLVAIVVVIVGVKSKKARSLPIAIEKEVEVEDATELADVNVCEACVAVACSQDVPLYKP